MSRQSLLLSMRDLFHELKDPLNAIHGGLELWSELPPDARETLHEALLRNSRILSQTLQQASLYLELEGGDYSAGPSRSSDLRSAVSKSIEECRPFLDLREQSVQRNFPAEPVWSLFPTEKVKAATSCALAALSRACPQGESLEVFLQVDPPLLRLGVRTTRPRLNYKDTGFRFQILQQLAHSLEGEVLLRIEPETELGLVLPHRDVAPEEVTIDSSDFVPSETRRVLVVDDNRDGADTMAMWLEAHGDRVEVAYEGEEALSRFQDFQPSVVLLDIGLPGKNGYEIASLLRAEGFRGMLIAITGYGQAKDRDSALTAGFDHHLVKPVNLKILREILDRPISRRILLVEDNPVARKVMESMVTSLGHEARSAGTGAEALEQLEAHRFDLMLCDLGLPEGMSGLELARRVRDNPKMKNLRLAAITGSSSARQEALEAGFDFFLEKPLKKQSLEELLALGD